MDQIPPPVRQNQFAATQKYLRVALALGLFCSGNVVGAPVISEFMADNTSTLADEDGGFSDWIEIYNPDSTSVNLGNYALTDQLGDPQKWIFPNMALPPHGYLVVFASGKNRRNPAGQLHANFSLNQSGESLALIDPDGTTVVSQFASFPTQLPDRAYGLGHPVTNQSLLSAGAPCRWKVPNAEIPGWQNEAFADTDWTSAATGVGYDTKTDAYLFAPYIGAGGNVISQMNGINATCYIRIPFTEAAPETVLRLALRIKYDDGFVAYLNGTKIAERNASPTTSAFADAPSYRWDDAALRDDIIDISEFRSSLQTGNNVLAIHGQNDSASNRDFLIVPALDIERVDLGAAAKIGFLPQPTPGTTNGAAVDGFVFAPAFSHTRGFYDSPSSISLTTTTPNAQIRYTIDGTAPTETHGSVYSTPVTIPTTTVLRAAAFRPDWEPSPIVAHTFLFTSAIRNQPSLPAGYPTAWGQTINGFGIVNVPADYQMDPTVTADPAYSDLMDSSLRTTLPILSVSTDLDPLFGSGGLYAGNRLGDSEIPVSLEYFTPDGSSQFNVNCGFAMHGGGAREHTKKPFRLYFRGDYGAGKLKFPLFENSSVDSFDQLILRPGGHDGWTATGFGNKPTDTNYHGSFMRDRFLRQTQLAAGDLAPSGRYVHLYLNGLYWGVYDLHERPNAQFFSDHLGGKPEDWDVLHHPAFTGTSYKLADGSSAAWDAVVAAASAGITTDTAYQQIQQYLDMDHFIDSFIIRIWAADYDWMSPIYLKGGTTDYSVGRFQNKNWYAGRRSRNGADTFHFFPWDGEFSMGLNYLLSQTSLPPGLGSPPPQHVLELNTTRVNDFGGPAWPYSALRKFPAFRSKFADRLQKMLFNNGALAPPNIVARLSALEAQLDLPIVAESARWGDALKGSPDQTTFTRDAHWRPEVAWLKGTFAVQRGPILLDQFRAIGLFPFAEAPVFSQHGGTVASGFQLGMTQPNPSPATIYYTTNGDDPIGPSTASSLTLIGATTPSQHWVPTSATFNASWRTITGPSNLATWVTGTSALGFDADAGNFFGPHFTTDVVAMRNANASLFIRIPFTLTAETLASITGLELRMKYDDGFVVHLNNSVVARSLAPVSVLWNSAATGAHDDNLAIIQETFPLSSQVDKLVVGNNILTIQGLNATSTDDDFLIAPELVAITATAGLPTANAQIYTNPVPLTHSGPVKARVKLENGTWSAMTEAPFIVGEPASANNLVITEIDYHPANPTNAESLAGYTNDTEFEFIELQNISTNPVETAGVYFSAGIEFEFPAITIAPGHRVIIARNGLALAARYGGGLPVIGTFANGSQLANSGERITLLAANNSVIADLRYDDDSPWPGSADGGGYSLVLRRPQTLPDASLAGSWRTSVSPTPTPGGADADTFSAWAGRHSLPATALNDADDDGVPLLLEYAMGTDPGEASTLNLVTEILPGNKMQVKFRRSRSADDIQFLIEISSDLQSWIPVTGDVIATADDGDGADLVTVEIQLTEPIAPTKFVRIRCSEITP